MATKKRFPQRDNTNTFFKQVGQFNKENTILWHTERAKYKYEQETTE